jgi:diadenosine tetraphosphatase ApaH/serine/threonine PP2A family protein phosphatase
VKEAAPPKEARRTKEPRAQRRGQREHRHDRKGHQWLRRISSPLTSATLLAVAMATALSPLLLAPGDRQTRALESGTIVVAAFLPGWLFVRFLTHRAEVLWHEYVLNLHRLRADHRAALPPPPRDSIYYEEWAASEAKEQAWGRSPRGRPRWTLYQAKFEAHYGKYVTRWLRESDPASVEDPGSGARTKGLISVALAVAVLAAGWASIISTRSYAEPLAGTTDDALRLAFLGAYVFTLQMLMRRFFQGDLKASAYISTVVRVLTVLVVAAVVNASPVVAGADPGTKAVIAFVIGLFPIAGLQLLQKTAWRVFGWLDNTFTTAYPLNHLDGLNVWYEARLLEEGIEDLQNLVTANIVEVMLHTRVPVGRLIDWIDQAILYLHLPAEGRKATHDSERDRLRRLGIRNATELLHTFKHVPDCDGERPSADAMLRWALKLQDGKDAAPAGSAALLLRAMENEPNLLHVEHWKGDWTGQLGQDPPDGTPETPPDSATTVAADSGSSPLSPTASGR